MQLRAAEVLRERLGRHERAEDERGKQHLDCQRGNDPERSERHELGKGGPEQTAADQEAAQREEHRQDEVVQRPHEGAAAERDEVVQAVTDQDRVPDDHAEREHQPEIVETASRSADRAHALLERRRSRKKTRHGRLYGYTQTVDGARRGETRVRSRAFDGARCSREYGRETSERRRLVCSCFYRGESRSLASAHSGGKSCDTSSGCDSST